MAFNSAFKGLSVHNHLENKEQKRKKKRKNTNGV